MQEDDDNQNLVLGILFGIIALVIGTVIGLTVYVTGQTNTKAASVAEVAEVPEIAEVGDALAKSSTSTLAWLSCPPMLLRKWPRSSPSCRKIPARSC